MNRTRIFVYRPGWGLEIKTPGNLPQQATGKIDPAVVEGPDIRKVMIDASARPERTAFDDDCAIHAAYAESLKENLAGAPASISDDAFERVFGIKVAGTPDSARLLQPPTREDVALDALAGGLDRGLDRGWDPACVVSVSGEFDLPSADMRTEDQETLERSFARLSAFTLEPDQPTDRDLVGKPNFTEQDKPGDVVLEPKKYFRGTIIPYGWSGLPNYIALLVRKAYRAVTKPWQDEIDAALKTAKQFEEMWERSEKRCWASDQRTATCC